MKEYVRTPYVRDIVILGGSYAGLEIAKAFHRLGRNVRIIERTGSCCLISMLRWHL